MQAGLSSPHLTRLILFKKHPVRTLGLLALLRFAETLFCFGMLVVLPLMLEMGTIGSNEGGFQLMGAGTFIDRTVGAQRCRAGCLLRIHAQVSYIDSAMWDDKDLTRGRIK
ncbi:hypothetical protein CKAH01_03386 [Colletotrichum kahawae]|uniref:Uncharacterized protein n=1 Tax=Colletotrichum kahawae TaxID=34407 RepID=A0AAD9YTZ8_COLKA|nr:hypothetical protein CKAH01_03386 [Colletotrichum kahawae]